GGSITFQVASSKLAGELKVDDSVAVNGVCQTVIGLDEESFRVCAGEETLKKTTLGLLEEGDEGNLELPMKLGDRLGGHMVLGHVDTAVKIVSFLKEGDSWLLSVEIPSGFLRYIIPVGSIALDGISLTVARLEGNIVTAAIIPHTFQKTVVKHYQPGKLINAEFDILGKYAERFSEGKDFPGQITLERLKEQGY